MITPKLRERDIARACRDFLALDGWRILNCEPVSRKEWGRGFGEKGMADTLCLRYESVRTDKLSNQEIMWIEWKAPSGRLAPHQRAWHTAERARGAMTLIAGEDFEASIDGFILWYRGSGLNRGRV